MVFLKIDLGLDKNHTELFSDLYKYSVILIVFQVLTHLSNTKNYGFTGNLLNDDFLGFLLLIGLSFMSYYLVATELIEFV